MLDTNNDGVLSREELIEGYKQLYPTKIDIEAQVDQIMAQVDTDRNGTIDYSEFVVATIEKNKLLNRSTLEAAFNAFDKDGNGSISADEIRSCLG